MMSWNGGLVKRVKEREWMLLERLTVTLQYAIHHTFLRFILSN